MSLPAVILYVVGRNRRHATPMPIASSNRPVPMYACLSRFAALLASGIVFLTCLLLAAPTAQAQSDLVVHRSENRPLASLRASIQAKRATQSPVVIPLYEVPNKTLEDMRTHTEIFSGPDPLYRSTTIPSVSGTLVHSFDGASNDTNFAVMGGLVAPPDPAGDVGPNHYVQMINLVTTIYDKDGTSHGAFDTSAFWAGFGGLCETTNRGDPIVLYDEAADRWLVSQFAFATTANGNPAAPFLQCVAVSQTGDPEGAYNRYAFDYSDFGFNDYPKHGITSESITLSAHLFNPATGLSFAGGLISAMDKAAVYAGLPATVVSANVGLVYGFVAADLDDPVGAAGFVPALFAAPNAAGIFRLYEIDVDWSDPGSATWSANELGISPFDDFLCPSPRQACIDQPPGGADLEDLTNRLMQRLQIRDFGSYKTMVASHTVDADGTGRAGIRWYEFRDPGTGWGLYQEGTYAPDDTLHRWMPSIAMNAAGDIGLGYMLSSSSKFVSTYFTGQTAEASGTGSMNVDEIGCVDGTGVQSGTGRSGDYSATAIDPVTDSFWHTNEYMIDDAPANRTFVWATRICEVAFPQEPEPEPEPATDTLLVSGRWNLLGLPLEVPDPHTDAVFDSLPASPAYTFEPGSGYVGSDSVQAGDGFWMLFDDDTTIVSAGEPDTLVTRAVATGWNLVSGPGCAMPIADIVTTPPGLIVSSFYRFGPDGYEAASVALEPWRGYWVLINGAGVLTMACP